MKDGALRASEDRFRRMLNIDRIGVLVFDESGTLIEANDAFLRMFGYTRDQLAARTLHWRLLTPPEYIAESERQLRVLAATGRIGPYEKEYFCKDGSRRWMLFVGASLGDGNIVEYAIDISDPKRAELALRASEERLRLALAAARMGIWTLDLANGTQTRDASLNRLIGLPPVDSTQPFTDFLQHIHPDDRAAVEAAFAVSARDGSPLNLEFRVVWPDGTIRWLRDQGDVFGNPPGGRHMAGACVDVTERRLAEEAVRASEERLRLIVASATDYAILTLSCDRTVRTWSPGAVKAFGYTEEEMIGRSGDILFTPEDRAAGQPVAEAEQARRFGRAEDERWHVRKDGSRLFVSGVLTPLAGGEGGFVKVLRDLTERKQMSDALRQAHDELEARVAERTAELRQSQERALQAERLAAIGQTITTLAHEGRNALQRAHGCLARLGWRLEGRPEELDLTERAQQALGDLTRLFDDIRNYASPIQLDLRTCDVREVWRGAWAQASAQRPDRNVQLEEDADGVALHCIADPFRLEQVFTNLFANALDACPDLGRVVITCRQTVLDDQPALCIRVRDNGPGFTPELRHHAFEPFRTTKAKGTGLGLAIVKRIVDAHGGTITVEDGVAGGASLVLTLPCHPR